jgi:hypothetical protein
MNEQRRQSITIIGLAIAGALVGRTAHAQAGAKVQSQETNVDGVTAEIVDAVRKEGVLTLKVRYRNSGSAPARLAIYAGRDASKYYVTAGSTKFLMLKDSQGEPLSHAFDTHGNFSAEIKPNGSFLYWAKYPAPPAEAKKFNFFNPHTPPFEDVPITESK